MKDWRLIYIIFAKSEDKLYISNKNRQAYFVLLSVCIIFVRINLKNCNVMFDKETYVQRRALLKKNIGSGVLLFLGNDEQGLNYEDNAFRYRQDSTFLYYFGLSFAGLSAIIDIDEDKEIIFGDELTIDHIVWMGTQPTLKEKSERVGIRDFRRDYQLSAQSCTKRSDSALSPALPSRT